MYSVVPLTSSLCVHIHRWRDSLFTTTCAMEEYQNSVKLSKNDIINLKINGNGINLSLYMYFYPLFCNGLDIGVNVKIRKNIIL